MFSSKKHSHLAVLQPLSTNSSIFLRERLRASCKRTFRKMKNKARLFMAIPVLVASIAIAKPIADVIRTEVGGPLLEGSHKKFYSPSKVRLPGQSQFDWILPDAAGPRAEPPLSTAIYEYAPAKLLSEKIRINAQIDAEKKKIDDGEPALQAGYYRMRNFIVNYVPSGNEHFHSLELEDMKNGRWPRYCPPPDSLRNLMLAHNARCEVYWVHVHKIWKLNYELHMLRPKFPFSAVWGACSLAAFLLLGTISNLALEAAAKGILKKKLNDI